MANGVAIFDWLSLSIILYKLVQTITITHEFKSNLKIEKKK